MSAGALVTEAEMFSIRWRQVYSVPPWERATMAWLLLGIPVEEPLRLPGEPDLSELRKQAS